MTIDQLKQADIIYTKMLRLQGLRAHCNRIIGAERGIRVTLSAEPSFDEIQNFKLPQDITEAVMTKAVELLDKRIKELGEELKQI